MQKTLNHANDYPQRNRAESEWYEEVQTFMWLRFFYDMKAWLVFSGITVIFPILLTGDNGKRYELQPVIDS